MALDTLTNEKHHGAELFTAKYDFQYFSSCTDRKSERSSIMVEKTVDYDSQDFMQLEIGTQVAKC